MISSIIDPDLKKYIEKMVNEVLIISLNSPSELIEFSLMNIEDHIQQMCQCLICNDICGFNRHYEISFNLIENIKVKLN